MSDRLDPQLKENLEAFPPIDLDNLQKTRQGMAEMQESTDFTPDNSITISNKWIPGPKGAPDVRIRIYQPKNQKNRLPGLLWMHKGGYVVGDPDADDPLCQKYVSEAQCVVVSVDYRLAPENPYPAALEDCYASLLWLVDNAEELGVDTTRIGLAGASAGGGLAAALSLLARDRKGPKICFQMPLYPMMDDRNNTLSNKEITGNLVWNHDLNEKAWALYLEGKNGSNQVDIYASPSRATDLSDLPPTYTCVGQLDPFRDETLDYVTRLAQAGVDVEFHLYPGCHHGFEIISPEADVSKRALEQYVDALKRGLHREVPVTS